MCPLFHNTSTEELSSPPTTQQFEESKDKIHRNSHTEHEKTLKISHAFYANPSTDQHPSLLLTQNDTEDSLISEDKTSPLLFGEYLQATVLFDMPLKTPNTPSENLCNEQLPPLFIPQNNIEFSLNEIPNVLDDEVTNFEKDSREKRNKKGDRVG